MRRHMGTSSTTKGCSSSVSLHLSILTPAHEAREAHSSGRQRVSPGAHAHPLPFKGNSPLLGLLEGLPARLRVRRIGVLALALACCRALVAQWHTLSCGPSAWLSCTQSRLQPICVIPHTQTVTCDRKRVGDVHYPSTPHATHIAHTDPVVPVACVERSSQPRFAQGETCAAEVQAASNAHAQAVWPFLIGPSTDSPHRQKQSFYPSRNTHRTHRPSSTSCLRGKIQPAPIRTRRNVCSRGPSRQQRARASRKHTLRHILTHSTSRAKTLQQTAWAAALGRSRWHW